MKFLILTLFMSAATSLYAKNYIEENVTKLNWNGIEVIWLEDNQLPTYDISIYFEEGALGEKKDTAGVSELMFNQLTSGTTRYGQKEIIESLEFYGSSYGSHVTHEFSTFEVSGLIKDYIPTMKMVCHLFSSATFPKVELKKIKRRIKNGIESIVTKHGALANHIFRYESLKGTGYERPVSGSLKTLKKIKSQTLFARLKFYNEKTNKRIYIKGPKEILGLENIFTHDCGWKKVVSIKKDKKVKDPKRSNQIIFVTMPEANQAQVRLGRVLTTDEVNENTSELKSFAAKYMGGGFTSQLIQGLRVKKGLTYSAGAYSSEQKMYGRSGISTFTKNETIVELLNSIKEIVEDSSRKVPKDSFHVSKRNIKGNYLLGLESTSEFLKTLMFYDHIKKNYADIYKFSNRIENLSNKDLSHMIKQIFAWERQTILVLGASSVAKKLEKSGFKLKRVNYKKYL